MGGRVYSGDGGGVRDRRGSATGTTTVRGGGAPSSPPAAAARDPLLAASPPPPPAPREPVAVLPTPQAGPVPRRLEPSAVPAAGR